jgi:hypothetical protein
LETTRQIDVVLSLADAGPHATVTRKREDKGRIQHPVGIKKVSTTKKTHQRCSHYLPPSPNMRLPFFTVAILVCLITLVAAWSKEGKFAPDT